MVTSSRVLSHSMDRFRASRKSCRLTHFHPGTTLCDVQHRMVLVDFQLPRDDTGHSSKVGYHNPLEACCSHSNIEKRWDWTRMTLIVSGLSPISLFQQKSLSACMVNRQLTDFLESYKLLPKIQSGFRSCHSTEW